MLSHKNRLSDIALPESEFYHDVTYLGSIFPNKELIKESFIEFKTSVHSAEKCHSWFMNKP